MNVTPKENNKNLELAVKKEESADRLFHFEEITSPPKNKEEDGLLTAEEKERDIEKIMANFIGLPEKVQSAILLAQKKKYTDFYYALENVNDKIKVYTKLFQS